MAVAGHFGCYQLCGCQDTVMLVVGAARSVAVSDLGLQLWGNALRPNGSNGGLADSHSSSCSENFAVI